MEHIKLETLVDSPEFWNDPYTISQYVNSLVGSCGKLDVITVKIGSYSEQPHVTFSKTTKSGKEVPHYTIYLPKVKDFYFDETLRSKDVKLRKAFLKHEVAHIIFSEMENYRNHKTFESGEEFLLNNALEDVRIEHKFGQRFQGANNTFFEVQELFYKDAKHKIENGKVNIFMLALFFLYRSKKFTFEVTPQTTVYERYYQKYKNFLNLSPYELSSLVTRIKTEFESEFSSSTSKKQKESDTDAGENGKKTKNNSKEQSYEEADDDEESNDESASGNKSDTNGSEFSESDVDNNSDEQSYDSESSGEGSSESEVENDSEQSSGSESGGEDDYSATDFSKSLASEMQKNNKQEEEAKEKVKAEKESNVSNSDAYPDSNGKVNVFALQPLSSKEVETLFSLNDNNDFVKYENSSMKRHGSEVVDISHYATCVAKRSQFKNAESVNGLSYSGKKKTYQSYEKVVAKNRKNINSLVNYFKLKFQQRERSFNSFNKEEGLLHNEALYKLFNTNFDKKVFYAVQKSVATKSDVSFLLDFSGSMSGSKVKSLVHSLIVLNEVFSRLEIPFNVFSFNGRNSYVNLYTKNNVEKNLIKAAFKSAKSYEKTNETENCVSFNKKANFENSKEVTYCWIGKSTSPNDRKSVLKLLNKSVNEKAWSTEFQKNWHHVFFGGSTPEVQSVIALYNTLKPQKLFLINDGSYDKAYLNSEERREALELFVQKKSYLSCVRSLLNLVSGKQLTFYSEAQLNFFKNEVLWGALSFVRNKSSYYHTETLQASLENGKLFYDQVTSFVDTLKKVQENKSKSFTVKYGQHTFCQTYNASSDTYVVTLTCSNFKPVLLKVEQYEVTNRHTENQETKATLLFPGGTIDSLYKLLCYQVYSLFDSYSFEAYITKDSSEEYTYKNLFQQMRNNGWSVWGIGIECWNGASYLGKENFSYVSNSNDIQQNFEKKIKSVV